MPSTFDIANFYKNLKLGKQCFDHANETCFGGEIGQAKESCMTAYAHYKEAVSVYCSSKSKGFLSKNVVQAYIGAAKACLLYCQCDLGCLQDRILLLQLADDAIIQGVTILRSNYQQPANALLANAFECRSLICTERASIYEKNQRSLRLTHTLVFSSFSSAKSSFVTPPINNAPTSHSFQ